MNAELDLLSQATSPCAAPGFMAADEGNVPRPDIGFATSRYVPTYRHHVPGRLRIKVPELRGDRQGEAFRVRLQRLPGVTGVTANPLIGSFTINYDPGVLDAEAFTNALSKAGVEFQEPHGSGRCICGRRPETSSSWKDVAAAGMAAHVLFDILTWSVAAGALTFRA